MKRILFIISILQFIVSNPIKACVWCEDDFDYSLLFFQSYVDDYSFYDKIDYGKGNVEEWAKYLGLSYEDAYYLVFTSKKHDIEAAINGYSTDERMKFLTKDFVTKYRKALQYLICAKNIEPYASTNSFDCYDEEYCAWQYYEYDRPNVDDLDYKENISMLQECCESETDEELKIRYVYQLIRFAHYGRQYSDAIAYFDKYLSDVKNKTELYYYALSQKAGAMYHLGKSADALRLFVKVFCHSTDLKETAYRSIFKFCSNDVTMNALLHDANTIEEKNDVYLMLGYSDFCDKFEVAKKVVANDPNAPQARKLISQYIKQLEQPFDLYMSTNEIEIAKESQYLFPTSKKNYDNIITFLSQTASKSADADFWNTTLAYVYFLATDFAKAKSMLDKLSSKAKQQNGDIDQIYACIDVCQINKITTESEANIYNKYKDKGFLNYGYFRKILSNRYFINKEYAKAYLCVNGFYRLSDKISIALYEQLRDFIMKKNKTPMEEYLLKSSIGNDEKIESVLSDLSLAEVKAAIAFGEIEKASQIAEKYKVSEAVDRRYFAHNIGHTYGFENLHDDYIDEFLGKNTNVALTTSLQQLNKMASDTTNAVLAAKANYLLGNFYYNISCVGPCRHYLKDQEDPNDFSSYLYSWNENTATEQPSYEFFEHEAKQTEFFDVDYGESYQNTVFLGEKYFNKALALLKYVETEKELEAHIIFGQAKCERARNENHNNWYFTEYTSPLFDNLCELSSTDYYQRIKTECSTFEYYCN